VKLAHAEAGGRVRRLFLVGLVGVLALLCASCGGGPQHLAAKQVAHKAGVDAKSDPTTTTTDPPSTTTSTTAASPKTEAGTYVPAVAAPAPAPAPAATTTTTDPFPPGCAWSDFAANVTSDQSTYAAGQPVQITLELANAGPACTVTATGYACPLVNVDNAAGTLVWSSAAPVSAGCPSSFTAPTVLASNWSQSFSFSWGQTTCTPGQASGCPGPHVPAGQYQITGLSSGGSSQIPAGTPATITLTAASS
jgi:hypothetical protein